MTRTIFQRKMLAGDVTDNAANAIYLNGVAEICKALAKANTKEALERKLALLTLWVCCGRSSETSNLHFDGMKYDSMFTCVETDVPQSKSSKPKKICLVAGAHRHLCWFLAFGDYMISLHGSTVYTSDEPNWLFPNIQGAGAGSPR